jgi:DNA-binding transcriptional ArsR family regulator
VNRNRALLCARFAPWNGRHLNATAIARRLEVTRQTVAGWLRALEREGLVHTLPRYGGHGRPLLYLTDSSYGFCLHAIVCRLSRILPECRFWWWKTGKVRKVDLLALSGELRLGFCLCLQALPRRKDWLPLLIACRRGLIERGFLLHEGNHAFVAAKGVQGLPTRAFLLEIDKWTLCRGDAATAREARCRINSRFYWNLER